MWLQVMSCIPSRSLFGLSCFGRTHCLSGASPLGCVSFVCFEKQMSNSLRSLSWVTSVPHTSSSSTHTHSLHCPGGTSWGSLFCSQDCQKDLSISHVLLCASGSPSSLLLELPWIVHSRSTVKAYPSIIFPGLRMLRQISIEFVMRLRAISPKKPSLCSTMEPKLVSNMNQLLSTIIVLFSNSIVI